MSMGMAAVMIALGFLAVVAALCDRYRHLYCGRLDYRLRRVRVFGLCLCRSRRWSISVANPSRRRSTSLGRLPGIPSGLALASLTLAVAAVFFAEGVLGSSCSSSSRALLGAGWILFDGIVTLLLAYLIWRPWPASSTWAIGTLVGINLIMSGFTRLMYSVTAHKTIKAIA